MVGWRGCGGRVIGCGGVEGVWGDIVRDQGSFTVEGVWGEGYRVWLGGGGVGGGL